MAVVTGGPAGAQREQSSLVLMSPEGRVWLSVNAITLPVPRGVASPAPVLWQSYCFVLGLTVSELSWGVFMPRAGSRGTCFLCLNTAF